MAPGQGGKRKRGDRSWSGDSASNEALRPSPHRPGTLNMAQHPSHSGHHPSPQRDQNDVRDRFRRPSGYPSGGRGSSRRGSFEGQNFSSSQHRESSAMSAPPRVQSREGPDATQKSGEYTASQATQPPAPSTPAPQPQPQPASRADSEATTTGPPVPPHPYEYEYVTDSAVEDWASAGKQEVVSQGTTARLDQDLARLASVYQELIRSAMYSRLSPSEAGNAVKEIIGDAGPDDEAQNPSTSDFDSSSLFLDTLSIMTDADTSNPALRPLVFATAISPELMRLQLDTPLLQSLGLVRETFARMGIRKQTNLLYRQSNYNLLREESEGYSKLVTELFTTSSNEPPSSEVVEDTFERVKAMIGAFDMDVGRVLDVTLDVFAAVLVKQYRFFVKLLRASSWWPKEEPFHKLEGISRTSGLPKWALPGSTGWNTTEEERASILQSNEQRDREFWDRVRQIGIRAFFEIGRKPLSEEEKKKALPETNHLSEEQEATRTWIEETGTLPPKGNRVAAQLLGFKLRFYSSSARSKSDNLPDNLIYLAALLIKVGFISLRDLYAHLWRPDDSMDVLKEEKMAEKAEREKAARPGGGVNALMLAGALSDDTLPPPSRLREPESRVATPSRDQDGDKQPTAKPEDALPDPSDQKVLLLKSLLAIGAIPESLFVMSRFPWLMDGYPELPDFIHRIIHYSLSKVYTPLQPLASLEDLPGHQRILSPDQSGVVKGHLRLTDALPRRVLRWAQLDTEDTNEGIAYRFYWDDWADNIPVCQSVDDVFALCSSFLNLSGHKIGQDASLLTKLARIGTDSLAKDGSEANKTRWRDLCKRLLLPAVSLTKANPGVVNEVFNLISLFPREVRYNMYAEWYSGQTSRLPDIQSAFKQATAETKDVLKRLSKTNIRPMARALAKIAYANPGIVINVAIGQIESYENLIEVVVECARYFTNLGYDILTWSLINSLGQKGRSRVQEGGLLTSRWLNALSTFAGRTFKRYSVMDPTPLLQYVVEQLRRNNSTDLIVLEQMISSMAGIITDTNFNDAQIQAMAGGEVLQSQTILQLLDKRHESKTTSKRLLKSLTHTRLAGQLLVAIAQERMTCVFNESSSELKLLGNVFDEIHRILTQYLDLLRSNLSIEEFDSFVPDFASLVKDFGIQPEIAFWIRRPSVSRKIADTELSKQKAEVSSTKAGTGDGTTAAQANDQMDVDEGEVPAETEGTADETAMDVDKTEQPTTVSLTAIASSPLAANPIMQDLIETIKSSLPADTWESVGAHFYATFWQLSLYDVHVPEKYYDEERRRLQRRVTALNNDRSDLSMIGMQRKDQTRRGLNQIQDQLLSELKAHTQAYAQTRGRLQKEKERWFAHMRLKYDPLNVALLEQCFIPRLLLSPVDAFFCFKMLKFLHNSGTPNFRTMGLLDQLFREHRLVALIFLCTSKEADNLGQFLGKVMGDLSEWHADQAVYEKEAFGSKRDLPGFAKKLDPEGVPVVFLDYEDFRRLLYKWHRLVNNALQTCLKGGEYMHIRNAISILKAIVPSFPAVNWMGTQLLETVNLLSKNDERDDVKIPAASLIGDFNRRSKKWMLPQQFYINNSNVPDAGDKAGSQPPGDRTKMADLSRPQSATPTPLNASAPEFKPGTQDSAGLSKQEALSRAEVEDGEIEDAKMTDALPMRVAGEAKPVRNVPTPTGAEHATPTAMDTNADDERLRALTPDQRGQRESSRSRLGSRAPDSARQLDIPKRPEVERPPAINPRQQARLPRHSATDNRLPPRPDLMDDRRDRHPDFNPRTRHNAPEHIRFDGPGLDGRGQGRMGDRDRDFPMRPPPDDPMRGPPYREGGRLPRDAEWPSDRPGRPRHDSFHGREGPPRGDLLADFPERPGDGSRRGEPPIRPEKDDRRPYSSRGPSPPRADLPNRPERFPEDRRSASFPQPGSLPGEIPRGPRAGHDQMGPDMNHGRLRQPDQTPDIPSGPRQRNRGRNVSAQQPAPSPSNGKAPTPERQLPMAPGRHGGRGGPEQTPATPGPPGERLDVSGVHPDRLNNIVDSTPQAPSPAMTPQSGPRGGIGHQQGPRGPGGERGRGDKRFAGINNMLQQTNGPAERGNVTPPVRGRGSNRQSAASNTGSPRPPTGPAAAEDEGQPRNRPEGRGDLLDDATTPDNRRSGRGSDRDKNRDQNRDRGRRGGAGGAGGAEDDTSITGNRREERRDRPRDSDRERSRRSDVGAGGSGREDKDRDRDRHTDRRNPGSREEMRRRDRRDRDDGPPEMGGAPPTSGNVNENEGRLRPPSSMGAPPPPPPPPPPPLPSDENTQRRWGQGGDRGNRPENRDRERERRDRGRERDGHHRESGGGSAHRKRGRPNNPEDNAGGDANGRGPRMGGDSKRPRRGQ